MEIFSDASKMGCGACYQGHKANGFWTEWERTQHINWLELCAAFYALKCFAKHKSNCNILLRIDNITAIACVNKMGSTRYIHLNSITRMIWDWCEIRGLFIFASYINTKDNITADFLSRNKASTTEFELNEKSFLLIIKTYDIPDIDLFASKANAKCLKYV